MSEWIRTAAAFGGWWLLAAVIVALWIGARIRARKAGGEAPAPPEFVVRVIAAVLHRHLHPAGSSPTCAACRELAATVIESITDAALEVYAYTGQPADVSRETPTGRAEPAEPITAATVTACPTSPPSYVQGSPGT